MGNAPKALMIATVASMIDLFNMDNIAILESLGYEVHVAANFRFGNVTSQERVDEFKQELLSRGIQVYDIPVPRNVASLKGILHSYRIVKGICSEHQYRIVHCHSPIGGVIARLGAKEAREKYGTKVIYTAHGFHFYKGAPLKNWLIYYPIEKLCSIWTDVLITINKEDSCLAQKKMRAKKIRYIPGIGVNLDKFQFKTGNRERVRQELGIKPNEIMLLSVGELNKNKNHAIIIEALAAIGNKSLRYVIAGKGDLREYLENLANKLGIAEQVHLLGYRADVVELYKAADVFVHPSLREGLPISVAEAMASALPCITSKIRGSQDLIIPDKGGYLFDIKRPDQFTSAIEMLSHDPALRKAMGEYNALFMQRFSRDVVIADMENIYNQAVQ